MFKTWSYTSWSNWKECPAKAKYQHIDKIPQPKSFALEKGIMWHSELEEFLLDKRTEVPSAGYKFIPDLFRIKELGAIPEAEWGVTRDWSPVFWNNRNICGRAKVDVWYVNENGVLTVIDFKTGKEYASHAFQASLYAVVGNLHLEIDKVQTQMWYLETGNVTYADWSREKLLEELAVWKERIDHMLSDEKLEPTPSREACRWCPFKNGNPCNEQV